MKMTKYIFYLWRKKNLRKSKSSRIFTFRLKYKYIQEKENKCCTYMLLAGNLCHNYFAHLMKLKYLEIQQTRSLVSSFAGCLKTKTNNYLYFSTTFFHFIFHFLKKTVYFRRSLVTRIHSNVIVGEENISTLLGI